MKYLFRVEATNAEGDVLKVPVKTGIKEEVRLY